MFSCFFLLSKNFVGSHGALQHPHDIHRPGARERKYITSDWKLTLSRGLSETHWDEFVPVSDATVATVESICKSFNTDKALSACVREKREVHKQLLDSIYSAL